MLSKVAVTFDYHLRKITELIVPMVKCYYN